MAPIATVERDAKLEGKNMFMILAPRAVPAGPPKFTSQLHPDKAAAEAQAHAAGKVEDDDDDADTDADEVVAPAAHAHVDPPAEPEPQVPEPASQGVASSA